jgi:hypothetical protein
VHFVVAIVSKSISQEITPMAATKASLIQMAASTRSPKLKFGKTNAPARIIPFRTKTAAARPVRPGYSK